MKKPINVKRVRIFFALTGLVLQFGQAVEMPQTGPAIHAKLAISHGGNAYDPDEWAASAFSVAIAWAFGKTQDIVHFDHSSVMIYNRESYHANMIESAIGATKYFNLNKNVVFDNQINPELTIANFAKVSTTLSEEKILFYLCQGKDMEMPWRCLNATPIEKRPFIHIVTPVFWGDGELSGEYTVSKMKALPGGAIFHDIEDQNQFLGKKSNWEDLMNFNEALNWLHSRLNLPRGATNDASGAGAVWWALTGSENGTPAEVIQKLKGATTALGGDLRRESIPNNLRMHGSLLEIRVPSHLHSKAIRLTRVNGSHLQVEAKEVRGDYLSFETAQLKNGLYIVSISDDHGMVFICGKVNIVQ